ncbi:MAG: spore coat associated protein CotJA [Ruminococcus sp.]|nr:spore coat associated protein CotJA [Ruminococcus sp.]
MAYVKFQPENAATYSPTQGFASGTMYPTLNKPFYGGKCGVHYD